MDVLLIGEAMGLFIADSYGDFHTVDTFKKGVSGAEMNVAIGLSRLGFDVSYITKLGLDPMGKTIRRLIESENIHTDHLIIDEDNDTGLQIKNKVKEDDPEVHYYRKNSAFSKLSKQEIADINFSQVKLVHVTGIPLALNNQIRSVVYQIIGRAKDASCLITFDPNIREVLWEDKETMLRVLNDVAQYADVFMPGLSEGKKLSGLEDPEEIADYYLDQGIDTIVIKDGGNGAYYKNQDSGLIHVSGVSVNKVVDTVGAGDGFAVGVISGILDDQPMTESVKRGNTIGAIQIQHQSDNAALPNREALLSKIPK